MPPLVPRGIRLSTDFISSDLLCIVFRNIRPFLCVRLKRVLPRYLVATPRLRFFGSADRSPREYTKNTMVTTHIIRNIRIYPYDIIRSRRVGCSSNFIGISLYSSSFRGLSLARRDYHPILLKKKKKRRIAIQDGSEWVSTGFVHTRVHA